MPTGYTAKLVESGQSFEQFVMGCARAFGVCVSLRDEPFDAEIPEFKPSSYHLEGLAIAKAYLADLDAMTDFAKVRFGQRAIAKEMTSSQEYIDRTEVENRRIEDMEKQILAWTPPSRDHEGLKVFILQQLDTSKSTAINARAELKALAAKDPMEVWAAARVGALQDIDYHTRHYAEEVERLNGRNQWVKQLRDSLKAHAAAAH